MKRFVARTRWMGLLLLSLAFSGCKSTDSAGDDSQVSVLITGHTEEEVRQTTIEVFKWNGYVHTVGLNFEKKGTKWDTAKYGGLSGNAVWFRMSAEIAKQNEGTVILGCDTYVIEDRDVEFMEKERLLSYGKRSDCKKILNQIKQRLSLPAASPQ